VHSRAPFIRYEACRHRKAAKHERRVLDVFITKLSNPFRRRDEHAKRAEVHTGEGTAASGLRMGRG